MPRHVSHLVDLRVGLVVLAGVVEHEHQVGHDLVQRVVGARLQLLRDTLQVDRVLDHLEIVGVLLQPGRNGAVVQASAVIA